MIVSFRDLRRVSYGLFAAVALAGADLAPAAAQDQAQQPAAEETFTPEHLQLAQEAVTLSRSAESFDDILPTLAEQTKTLYLRSNPAIAKDIEEVTQTVAIALAAKRLELDHVIQQVWARRFSVDELKEIIAFYKTPTGSKLAQLSPEVVALSIGAAKQWSDEISSLMVSQVREELQKRGHEL